MFNYVKKYINLLNILDESKILFVYLKALLKQLFHLVRLQNVLLICRYYTNVGPITLLYRYNALLTIKCDGFIKMKEYITINFELQEHVAKNPLTHRYNNKVSSKSVSPVSFKRRIKSALLMDGISEPLMQET